MGFLGWIFLIFSLIAFLVTGNYTVIKLLEKKKDFSSMMLRVIPLVATAICLFIVGYMMVNKYNHDVNYIPNEVANIDDVVKYEKATYTNELYNKIVNKTSNESQTQSDTSQPSDIQNVNNQPQIDEKYEQAYKIYYETKNSNGIPDDVKLKKYEEALKNFKEISLIQKNYKDTDSISNDIQNILNNPKMQEIRLVKYNQAIQLRNEGLKAYNSANYLDCVKNISDAINIFNDLQPYDDKFKDNSVSIKKELSECNDLKAIAISKIEANPDIKIDKALLVSATSTPTNSNTSAQMPTAISNSTPQTEVVVQDGATHVFVSDKTPVSGTENQKTYSNPNLKIIADMITQIKDLLSNNKVKEAKNLIKSTKKEIRKFKKSEPKDTEIASLEKDLEEQLNLVPSSKKDNQQKSDKDSTTKKSKQKKSKSEKKKERKKNER